MPEYPHPGVYIEEFPTRPPSIEGVATSIAAFVDAFAAGPLNQAQRILSFAQFELSFGGLSALSPASYGIREFFANGGREVWVVRVEADATGRAGAKALIGERASRTGLYALDDADTINLLCLPRAAELPGDEMRAVCAAAEKYCEARRAFLIVDIDGAITDPSAMQRWIGENEALRHPSAAVYFPRILIADPLNGNRPLAVAASGAIAGLYAHIDGTRGVWRAPAGREARLRNTFGPAQTLTDADNARLNALGVNCLRRFEKQGTVCWGARTLVGADGRASEWKYIPVRRLALFIEESVVRGTQWAAFEPNGAALWTRLKRNLGNFLSGLFRVGAFAGQTPDEAYFVKIDQVSNSRSDIDRGVVRILIGIAPLKPAEFIVLSIALRTGI